MAKFNQSVTYKDAIIDLENMTITEVTKDGEKVFNIMDELARWENEDGVTITIKKEHSVPGAIPQKLDEEDLEG